MSRSFLPTSGVPMRHRLAVLLQDGASPFEFAVACEVFGLHRPELGPDWYDFRLCAPEGSVRLSGGWELATGHDLDAAAGADTVIVPNAPIDADAQHPGVLRALRGAADGGARLASFCSGAFALAEAGVLDGRPATTHWMYADRLQAAYPRVRVDPNVLFVDDGDVLTSAGTAAGIDLSLHLVRRDHGADAARYVARRMVVPPHRDGGQAQYIDPPHQALIGSDDLAPLLDWIQEHLDEPLSVADLASRAAMSERTFARRFKEATGTTPNRWLVAQRLHRAQELLERTDLDVDLVADRAGFGTGANLRQHFRRELETTPSGYRRTFRGAA